MVSKGKRRLLSPLNDCATFFERRREIDCRIVSSEDRWMNGWIDGWTEGWMEKDGKNTAGVHPNRNLYTHIQKKLTKTNGY